MQIIKVEQIEQIEQSESKIPWIKAECLAKKARTVLVAADNMYLICRKTSCFSCGECQLIVDRGLTVKKNGDIVCITKQQSRKEDPQ